MYNPYYILSCTYPSLNRYLLSVGLLCSFLWNLGGGGRPGGWGVGELWRRVQEMDFWQWLMLSNMIQQVFYLFMYIYR